MYKQRLKKTKQKHLSKVPVPEKTKYSNKMFVLLLPTSWFWPLRNTCNPNVTAVNKGLNLHSARNPHCFRCNQSNDAAAENVSHTGTPGAAGAAQGRQRGIHGRRGRPRTTLVTQTLFLASVHHDPSSPPICHLPPKNLFHSMSQAQPLLVLMALSAEPPNPITF